MNATRNVTWPLLLLASASISVSGCLAADDDVVEGAQEELVASMRPINGAAYSPFLEDDRTAAHTWSLPAPGCFWDTITIGDVTGDAWDDACGSYSCAGGISSFGCARGNAEGGFEGWMELSPFGPPPAGSSIPSRIYVVDYDGDGRKDVCGLTSAGVVCQRSLITSFAPPVSFGSNYSAANGWTTSQYSSTIAFPRLEDSVTRGTTRIGVCGRGAGGIHCYFPAGPGRLTATNPIVAPEYSDANGWSDPTLYGTIQWADVNGDGYDDVCGRGYVGIWCSVYRPASHVFAPAWLWTGESWEITPGRRPQFSNDQGWDMYGRFSTIRFADVNGDRRADVCGRRDEGVYCGLSDGSRFVQADMLAVPGFADHSVSGVEGWERLVLADHNADGHADLCMSAYLISDRRIVRDLFCADSRAWGTSAPPVFGPVSRRTEGTSMPWSATIEVARILPSTGQLSRRSYCFVASGGIRCSNRFQSPRAY